MKTHNIQTVAHTGSGLRVQYWILMLLLVFVLVPPAHAQPTEGFSLMEGEELVYNVRYAFINLGQVRIRVLKSVNEPGSVTVQTKGYIDSYDGVPFADLHATYESWVDTAIFAKRFIGKSRDGDWWRYSRYNFDYEHARVLMESGTRDTIVSQRDTLAISGRIQDGLSLFFIARKNLHSGRAMNFPAIIERKNVNTYINFTGKRTSVEIDAVEYPIDVIEFEGKAEFVGIFGLTGDFEGWFSNDNARIPIMAKMEVIIGSVTLELMEWKRPGWTPPRGQE